MHIEHLVKMANQIGAFFDAMPDRTEAFDGFANHLRSYWDPRMRRQLLLHSDAGGEGLMDFVQSALKAHALRLAPSPVTKVPFTPEGDPQLPPKTLVAGDG